MRDLHVHTEFSCDSEEQMERYAEKGIRDGIQQICFTDHVDLNPDDYGFDYYCAADYFRRFAAVKEKYAGQVELLAGFEFGEPHLYFDRLKKLSELPYDYVIGSIHWIGNMFPCQKVRGQYSAKEFYTLYWKEVLKTVQAGSFDALGHIDFPKRYYGELYYEEPMLKEIFKTLLDREMIIEINTSSLRKGCDEMLPDQEVLQIYKDCGGQFITIGSDAHVEDDLGADYRRAKDLITVVGLQEVVYKIRKRIIV